MATKLDALRLEPLVKVMRKQGYHFANEHTAVKPCLWTKKALLEKKFCYKCHFYGIESHRCIQMTPAAFWCWNDCIHCWRIRPPDVGLPLELKMPKFDSNVEELARRVVDLHKKLLTGYWGNPKVDRQLLEEAMEPKHVAISLTGEPTLYEDLPALIREFHRIGLTTFLVTRGVRPDILERLEAESPPTQLYVSLEAYDKETYEKLNKPLVPRAWELTERALDMMRDFPSPTVLRITLIKGLNSDEKAVKGFSKIVERAEPTYVEVKAYMHVGTSVHRLSRVNMPSMQEVREFASMLSEETGLKVRSESTDSRVVVLSPLDKPVRFGRGCLDFKWSP